jgi:hypothetical protein
MLQIINTCPIVFSVIIIKPLLQLNKTTFCLLRDSLVKIIKPCCRRLALLTERILCQKQIN